MAKSFRVRTDVRRGGDKDKNITFELNQDFDLLEILSLSLTQQEVYTRMCADFGVVVGRVTTNGGFGIPNAKVSIFIPLDAEDEENEVIKFLYPFKEPFDVNDEGKRYNLLSSEKTFDCHVSVGTFPTLDNVLNKQEVKYVYDKYYKLTVKTNESGDFMIYGAPVGDQTIIMDVDVSDIGCFSLLPEDFKVKGYSDTDFDGPRFKDDRAINSLPQIMNLQKSIDVRPFWGDEEVCRASITRVDFDLSSTGFKLEPTSVFMGSTATDTDKDSVNMNCRPKRFMGELCSLITKPGLIDCIRYTPFFKNDPNAYPQYDPGGWNVQPPLGGEVPILERYYLENGGRVIDDTGAFLVHMPMNLDYMVTNEFGEMVLSDDPTVGVPTRTRVRFRVRPEQATGGARLRRIGSFLVPNIREYYDHTQSDSNGDWPGIESSSYAFSIEYSDYHPWAQRNMIPAAKDVFFDMTFNRVYTFAEFHDHIKHSGRRQFIGIKNILPEMDQQCSTTAMFFPINSAVRSPNLMVFLWMFLIDFLGLFYMLINTIVSLLAIFLGIILGIILVVLWLICIFWCAIYCFTFSLWGWTLINMAGWLGSGAAPPEICGQLSLDGFGCAADCQFFGLRMGFILFKLRQTKYPECEKCMCRTNLPNPTIVDSLSYLATTWPCPQGWPASATSNTVSTSQSSCVPQCPPGNGATGDDFGGKFEHDCCGETDDVRVCCPDNYGFDSSDPLDPYTSGTSNDGIAGGGCYVKIICFSPACIPENFNMKVLTEWTRREKISVALCNGIMNYFWENNWVNGFLYPFQFKAKVEYDEITESYATKSKYCKKLTYLHPTDHTFYYRSTPFKVQGSSPLAGSFIGDTDGVYKPWWMIGGGNATSDMHGKGDMDRHILFPTTIIDMGSRNQCIQQICLDPNYSEECSVTDQIGSTTFQDITNLVSDIYNIKMQFKHASMSTFFPRPEYEIGGDVAQALMQNCMLGVYGYETNMGGTGCDCDYLGMVSTPVTPTAAIGGLEYPSPNFTAGTYITNAVNVNNLNGSSTFDHNIMWEPLLFTGQTQTIMDGQNLIDCVTMSLSASSQYVPFYPWHQRSSAPSGFGDVWNDWLGTVGKYRYAMGVPGPLMSVLPAINLTTAEGTSIHPVGTNCTTGGTGTPCVWDGNYLHYMGNPPFTFANGDYPLMNKDSSKNMVFSQPLFYFFGLRPGATSYNTFVRKYIDEELADTVI